MSNPEIREFSWNFSGKSGNYQGILFYEFAGNPVYVYYFSFSTSCDSTKSATFCEWLIGGIRMSDAGAYLKRFIYLFIYFFTGGIAYIINK